LKISGGNFWQGERARSSHHQWLVGEVKRSIRLSAQRVAKIMHTEVVRIFELIDSSKLTDEDLEELLVIFNHINNDRICNIISFIFSDKKFQRATPHLIKKILLPEMQKKKWIHCKLIN
jgi:hypothetical protein